MTMRKLALKAMGIILFAVVSLGGANAALAQSTAAPKNLRVIGVTDWTVALMWDAPKGKAPSSYVVQCSNGHRMTVPGAQTTATFSSGFDYNRTYSFRVYGVSASGTWSSASNTFSATLLNDTTPAAKPVVSSTGDGPSNDLLAVKLDVTKRADAEAAVRAAVDRFGRIDVLVNNAASFHAGHFEELTPEQFERQLATSLIGP